MNDSFLNQNSRQVKMLYVIVADDAFPLSRKCMKHYPQKKLKYSRMVIFLSSFKAKKNCLRWIRIFHAKISLQAASTTKIVLCCCELHNMLRTL